MKNTVLYRTWIFILAVCLLCPLLLLPTVAAEPGGEAVQAPLPHSLDTINGFLSGASQATLIVLLILSFLICLLGNSLLRWTVSICGFVVGWLACMWVYDWLTNVGYIPAEWPGYLPYILYVVCGVLFIILAHWLFDAALFVVSAAAVFLFLTGISDIMNPLIDLIYGGDLPIKYLIARILIALVVGILSRPLKTPILIAVTALAGGMATSMTLMVLLDYSTNTTAEMVIGLLFAAIGLTVQIISHFGKKKKKE